MGWLGDLFDPANIFHDQNKNLPQTSQFMGPQFSKLENFGPNPYASPLQGFMSSMPKFSAISPTPLGYTGGSYTAKDMSKTDLPQYDAMRSRLNSQYSQQQSEAQDALDRQFAAAGGGPGNGTQAKQTENLAAGIAKQKGQDLEGINAEEAATRTQLQQAEQQKEFQSGEAARGYGFQANQFNAGQNLQAQEFNQQMPLQYEQLGLTTANDLAGLNTSWDQAEAEANNNEFNKALSEFQATHSGGLLGGGGFLGLGIGQNGIGG